MNATRARHNLPSEERPVNQLQTICVNGKNRWTMRYCLRCASRASLVFLLMYLGTAYLLLPTWWRHRRFPALDAAPKVTRTADGIPGDAVNVALVGGDAELVRAMLD